MKYTCIYMLTLSIAAVASEVTKEITQDGGVKFNITNKVENNNNHKITVQNEHKEDPYDCTKYIGTELKQRMAYVPKEHLTDNLIRFAPRTRERYRLSLTVLETEEVLQALDHQERAKLIKNLGAEGERFIGALEDKVRSARQEQDAANSFWSKVSFLYPVALFLIL